MSAQPVDCTCIGDRDGYTHSYTMSSARPSKTQPSPSTPRHTDLPSSPGRLPPAAELLTAGAPIDADLEVERQRRMEALKAKLRAMFAEGRGDEALDQVILAMAEMERSNERLAWQVLRAKRYRFGRSTEKLSHDELRQLLLALDGDDSATPPGAEPTVPTPLEPEQTDEKPTPETASPIESGDRRRKTRKRVRFMKVAPHVERIVTVAPIPEEERICALCGREKKVFGHVDHELIRYVPAKIVVDVERREKSSCVACRKDVSVAPRTQAPAIVRKVDPSLLSKLVSEKCSLALPLDRQRREFERLGLYIPDKTLQSYWNYTTDLLKPIAVCILSLVFGRQIVGTDDSHLKTLSKGAKNGTFRGHLWCFVGTDGTVGGPEDVGYGYTSSWKASEISAWFSGIDGFIQCDGYAGYSTEVEPDDGEEGETIVAVPSDRRLGCAMHVRSKFHDALLANDRRAAIAMNHFADLYKVEADAKERGLDADARGELRRKWSIPILDAFDSWVDETHPLLLPKSPLRRATTYAINQRAFLRRCFDDGRFEIDNGRVERRIRMFAVARRNFLFTGSPQGGERLAYAFTIVDSCLSLGIDPERYLADVIAKLDHGWPMRDLSSLTPRNWAAHHQPQDCPQ